MNYYRKYSRNQNLTVKSEKENRGLYLKEGRNYENICPSLYLTKCR